MTPVTFDYIEDTCLTFLIGGTSLFTFIARGTGTQKRSGTPLFLWPFPCTALPSTNVEVRIMLLDHTRVSSKSHYRCSGSRGALTYTDLY